MDIFRQAGSVLLVFGLLGLALWTLRRGGAVTFRNLVARRNSATPKSLQALERIALTPQHALHLVRVNGHEMVVATHPQGCTLLTESQKMGANG
jgi:flagellar biogenesis protein FliO